MKQLKAILFDFDGTLADSQWYWYTLGAKVLIDRGYPVTEEDVNAYRTVPHLKAHAELCKKYGATPVLNSLQDTFRYLEPFYENEVCWKPGAREFLEAMKARGAALHIFSVTPVRLLEKALRHLGGRDYFDSLISANDLGLSKHDPEAYRYCLRTVGARPEEAAMIEDRVDNLIAAKEAGLTVYGVREECFLDREAEMREIADEYVDELPELLRC